MHTWEVESRLTSAKNAHLYNNLLVSLSLFSQTPESNSASMTRILASRFRTQLSQELTVGHPT